MKGSVNEDDFSIVQIALELITAKMMTTWMQKMNYLHRWLLPFNVLKDGTPYDRCPVGNIPEFTTLDNSLSRGILHFL